MTFGSSGTWIFIIGAFMVLYSTYFVSTASNARLFADVTGIIGLHRTSRSARSGCAGAWWLIPILTLTLYFSMKAPVTLVMIGGTAQALMLPSSASPAVWFHRSVPRCPSARAFPGPRSSSCPSSP